eukprot:TRINITY_DN7727_c0_g1_i1.p1 TRINITY_DN7727_c0_g1~~TRINITY_DN7727_c0_g1_i1.p1  ORF type:complete len:325 (-),score=111.14 TRINITY_DN7727_c0_g1_i1:103-1077(-)
MAAVALAAMQDFDLDTNDYLHTTIVFYHEKRGVEHYGWLRRSCVDVLSWNLDALRPVVESALTKSLVMPHVDGSRPGELDGPQASPGELDGSQVYFNPVEVFPAFRSGFTMIERAHIASELYIKRPQLLFSMDSTERKERMSYAEPEVLFFETVLKHNTLHPNIVKYHGCIVANGRVTGLVLDKLPEMLAMRCLRKASPLNVDDIISQVKAALDHLHNKLHIPVDGGAMVPVSYCHNAVNTQNIMITKRGDREVAVLIDFDSCVLEGLPLGKGMLLNRSAKTSCKDNDVLGLQMVENELRAAFPAVQAGAASECAKNGVGVEMD